MLEDSDGLNVCLHPPDMLFLLTEKKLDWIYLVFVMVNHLSLTLLMKFTCWDKGCGTIVIIHKLNCFSFGLESLGQLYFLVP